MSFRLACSRAFRKKPISKGGPVSSLKQCLRLHDVVGFGLGVTIGGGIFVAIGEAVREAGPAVVLSFLLAASGCACSGLCYAEMSMIAPTAGSSYTFSYNAIGELAAFTVGIVNIVGNVLSGAAVARGWASYVHSLLDEFGLSVPMGVFMFELSTFRVSPAACGLVVLLWMVNMFGLEATAKMNTIITVVSIAMLTIFVVGAWSAVDTTRWDPFLPAGIEGVFKGAGTVFFAYLGFDVLACLGEEATDPKIIPRGILLTLMISTLLYCITAMTYTGLVTLEEVESAPLASASRLRGLNVIATCISIGAVGNTLTTVLGGILGAPRVCFVMAQDGLLPQCFARVNKHGTPVYALFITAAPTALFACFFEFGALADIVSAGALCSFSLVCVALILVRIAMDSEELGFPKHVRSNCRSDLSPDYIGRLELDQIGPELELDLDDYDTSEINSPKVSQGEAQADLGNLCLDEDGDRNEDCGVEKRSGFVSRPPRVIMISLVVFAACCLATGLLMRIPYRSLPVLMSALAYLTPLGAISAALCVVVSFRWRVSQRQADRGEFRLPLMPLIPLAGILMNMLLLSELPVKSLLRTLGVVLICCVFYFGYAGPRSRLNDTQSSQLVPGSAG